MKNPAHSVVVTIIFLVINFLIFALIAGCCNPRLWGQDLRVYCTVISGLCVIAAFGVYQLMIRKDWLGLLMCSCKLQALSFEVRDFGQRGFFIVIAAQRGNPLLTERTHKREACGSRVTLHLAGCHTEVREVLRWVYEMLSFRWGVLCRSLPRQG